MGRLALHAARVATWPFVALLRHERSVITGRYWLEDQMSAPETPRYTQSTERPVGSLSFPELALGAVMARQDQTRPNTAGEAAGGDVNESSVSN
ncbi:uncharacterized protein B0H64DRAFT_176332 [Chaetomium fimeti]|uniref:Uncharacterized protein n=1 Tax=Chaetomium fimeti TaxID=1854472 RepID=A0AAE0HCF5_9PEZI|nr:hypothetical protein B0H64DRAFT_176332 [Chaetomium fimeti]